MVEVTNALQPLPQRQLCIVPLDLVKEVSATASGLRRQSLLDQLCNDLLGGELEDRAVFSLDLPVGLIDDVEDRNFDLIQAVLDEFQASQVILRATGLRKESRAQGSEIGRQCHP